MDERELQQHILSGRTDRLHLAVYAFRPRLEVEAQRLMSHRGATDREMAVDYIQDWLIEDDFRRVREYQPPTKASTYLLVICRREMIGWLRQKEGKFYVPEAIAELGEAAVHIFKQRYQKNIKYSEILAQLRPSYPDLPEAHWESLFDQIEKLISPTLRRNLAGKARGVVSLDTPAAEGASAPEIKGDFNQETDLLRRAAARQLEQVWRQLNEDDKLLVVSIVIDGLPMTQAAEFLKTSRYHAEKRYTQIMAAFREVVAGIDNQARQAFTGASLVTFLGALDGAGENATRGSPEKE